MPGEVQVKKASEIEAPEGPQTDGMIRMPAIVDKSDQLCGTGWPIAHILLLFSC
jgi:hypothetical protein